MSGSKYFGQKMIEKKEYFTPLSTNVACFTQRPVNRQTSTFSVEPEPQPVK
jgi:hypothetical protein